MCEGVVLWVCWGCVCAGMRTVLGSRREIATPVPRVLAIFSVFPWGLL